ncbi:TM0106 family RecB-like putative nuclease [Psychrosphaera haliotis]|uniref:TM0106 family RecB-like putative nuclease n=1 Tax=Psychrosphaera haliotis TaxID=555083 RepID=UPI0031DE4B35
MKKVNGKLIFSPSDLTEYLDSPFASWMNRFKLEFPKQAPEKDKDDALTKSMQQRGYTHENNLIKGFEDQGKKVVTLEFKSTDIWYEETVKTMQQGPDVIVQALLKKDDFYGFADFLIKVPGNSDLGNYHYEVWDTKLSSKSKPSHVIQLCCYAEMIAEIQGCRPKNITIALGNGDVVELLLLDYYAYYQNLKERFLNEQSTFELKLQPSPSESKSWGRWSKYAEQLLLEQDHLFQVATITKGQIKKLNTADIFTMTGLAESHIDKVAGMNPIVFSKLKKQARIQCLSKGSEIPKFEVIKPSPQSKQGLALLPPASPLDVFFDIEGYPLDEGGLEYLWGNTYFDENGDKQFIDFWAHNAEQEKQCFVDFITWVFGRWQQDSSMHIYHYANYEIAACRKLMSRYGVCEYEVDQLLRNEVFVDLYKVVKSGFYIGEPRYSIKNVEHLYRGNRETEVGNGGDSIVVYEQWRELNQQGLEGDTWQTSKILNDIRDYNIDDCDSTQELVDWLRIQQEEHQIKFIGKTEVEEPEVKEEVSERTKLRDKLLIQAEQEKETDPAKSKLTENLAWMLEFHRREAKPIFWKLFDRLGQDPEALLDDLDCLAFCVRTEREPFKPTTRSRSLAYEYHFDTSQEFKATQRSFYILGEETPEGKSKKVTFAPNLSDLSSGLIVVTSGNEPSSLINLVPDEYVNPKPIPDALTEFIKQYSKGIFDTTPNAVIDFLLRAKPRIKTHLPNDSIVSATSSEEKLEQITHVVLNLKNSYLPIQGPPGAGKSFTGKHVITELLRQGKSVGIASNSHKAINNLLLSTAKHCKQLGVTASFACTKETEPDLLENNVDVIKNKDLSSRTIGASLVGTTAWGYARDDMENQLDYLFIDEAGQVSVANLIAMGMSTKNIVLMGDQMQLGQPSQGTHPMESGLSILDYLLHEQATIPDNMGVFLDTTYRMHSKVNQFVSDYVYESKLASHISNDKRYITIPDNYVGKLTKKAGLQFVPVEHFSNSQASEEEVDEIQSLVKQLIGRTFHTGEKDQPTRLITLNDILFVSPYNHQVTKLKEALGPNASVGSVDKFQGQEAPIVILSMCASDANESPRGLDFLFNKNRLNVAISRAQCLAIVVGNPELANTSVSKVNQIPLVNLLAGLVNINSDLL